MEEARREQILQIVTHFKGKQVSVEMMDEYCKLAKIEPIPLGHLEDYTVQVTHDEMVNEMFPKILEVLQEIKYKPEFSTQKERSDIDKNNDEVRIKIIKILESNPVPYKLITLLSDDLASLVGKTIEMAGQTVFNKSLDVMLHIAQEKFGHRFNAQDVALYFDEVEKRTELKDKTSEDK